MSKSSTDRIEKRIELKASVGRVWRAITDSKEFGQWFRVNLESPFTPGEPTARTHYVSWLRTRGHGSSRSEDGARTPLLVFLAPLCRGSRR